MMKKFGVFCLLLCLATVSSANVETVRNNLAKQYPNLRITQIQATEMAGLYSAKLDDQIVYLEENAQHIFLGSMIRLKDQKNLTKDLVIQQNSMDWKQLPLKDAIKIIKGNGQHQLAIFSDPNCPYCKKLETELDKLNNYTLYLFIYPLKPQSIAVSKQIWCDKTPANAWKNLLQRNIQPQAKSCEHPIDRNLELGRKLQLNGTPTLIFANGFKFMGLRSAEDIEAIWKELGL